MLYRTLSDRQISVHHKAHDALGEIMWGTAVTDGGGDGGDEDW